MHLKAHEISLPGRLTEVCATLSTGQVTAIVGPNGAGKSSLLACLAGILQPKSGAVAIGESDLFALSPRQRAQRIGYLAQSPEIAWDVTVETLVSLGRIPWRPTAFHSAGTSTSEDKAAIDAALSSMELTGLRSRHVSRLSGGERARVLSARVLAGNPDWILADEPLANLDLAHGAALMRLLRTEAANGRGVVVVLHDLATAMNHADRVIVLDQGSVVADANPDAALSKELIRRVWQTSVQWLGMPGSRALSIG